MTAPPILLPENAAEFLDAAVNPNLWTALIPAAGRGSRLGFDKPKILFPIAGRTILEWLVDLLSPLCSQFVFVLAPRGAEDVQDLAARLLPGRQRIALQGQPVGMADAIAKGLPAVETANIMIVWGDQVALQPASLQFVMRIHQGPAQPSATCPTVWRDRPYIHFQRDASGQVIQVLQAREGDVLPARGESDSGVFLFRTAALRRTLPRLLESESSLGKQTRELNFLPILPMLGHLITLPIMTEAESVGVNSPADAAYLERHLLSRKTPA
jgi:bifunctional UDP-N-acetylglucosamine pyrophosphorylase/glucosamine-1-phosphate N-acetyltransferase